jgi:dTDP-4-dehydrorhamnose 3,5-epimerase-like enzyme
MEEMYSKSRLREISNDRRGSIFKRAFTNKDYWFVEMRMGTLRGGHYHNCETQHLVIQGKIRFELFDPLTREKRRVTAVPMDVICVKAGIAHLLEALTDSMFIEPGGKKGTVDFAPQRARVQQLLKN